MIKRIGRGYDSEVSEESNSQLHKLPANLILTCVSKNKPARPVRRGYDSEIPEESNSQQRM